MLYSLLRIARVVAFICFFALLSNRSRAANVSVTVGNNFFSPKDITVNVGDTVIWVWSGSGHDTVATDGTWNSGLRNVGATFQFTFTAAHAGKRFDYFCTPHRFTFNMVGSVTVRAAANQPPTVSLTAPGPGATFLTTDQITFSANAGDTDGTINKVEFFSDGSLIGAADTTAPYSVTASLPAGQHTITAKATDNANAATTSTGVTITVNAPNQPPTVTLTAPSNGASFSTTDTITFSADASDDAGVNRVEFYSDGNLIQADTSAPYSVTATLAAGTHTITATAFDGPGLSTTSAPIQIQVSATAAAPHINSVTRNGSTTTIVASASDGVVHDLQATTDFVNWTVVDTKTAAGGTVTLTDATTEVLRFYRVAAH